MEIFSGLLPFCVGNSPVTGEFPHKGHWHGALMFSLICAWTNSWVNYRDAGDLRRHLAYNDVIVMKRKDHLGDSLVIIGYFIGRKLSCSHSSDVTWATQRLKSLAPILFGQQLIETKNKGNTSSAYYWDSVFMLSYHHVSQRKHRCCLR